MCRVQKSARCKSDVTHGRIIWKATPGYLTLAITWLLVYTARVSMIDERGKDVGACKLCWLTDRFSQRVCVSIDGDGLSHEGREIGQELKKMLNVYRCTFL